MDPCRANKPRRRNSSASGADAAHPWPQARPGLDAVPGVGVPGPPRPAALPAPDPASLSLPLSRSALPRRAMSLAGSPRIRRPAHSASSPGRVGLSARHEACSSLGRCTGRAMQRSGRRRGPGKAVCYADSGAKVKTAGRQ
ncbi:hypothetical protein CDD83_6059 [Cordyceps sp. RAO-2017]|nr:hypothetical protein CDD83_6059 [Cordyceps sp. RAO-2017]